MWLGLRWKQKGVRICESQITPHALPWGTLMVIRLAVLLFTCRLELFKLPIGWAPHRDLFSSGELPFSLWWEQALSTKSLFAIYVLFVFAIRRLFFWIHQCSCRNLSLFARFRLLRYKKAKIFYGRTQIQPDISSSCTQETAESYARWKNHFHVWAPHSIESRKVASLYT